VDNLECVNLELDATNKGWRCSGCGLLIDCIGRPLFGSENITVRSKSIHWIENKPQYKFCPKCGKPVKDVTNCG